MTRIINLNGRWQLSYTGEIYDKTIDIPGTIEITELSYPDPESLTGYFRRMIQLDEEDMKKNKWFKFYASDLETDVFLNGEQIGHHKGGFDAFEYDVGELLNRMENELVVKVSDKPIHQAGNEITGKQDWYGNITGLWQKVELKIVDRQFIRETAFEIHRDYIDLSLDIHGSWQRIAYVIFDGENCVGRGESETSDFRIPRNTLRLWSPEEPKRYRLNLSLKNGTDILDQTTCWIGFREIEQREHQLFLNGKPFYMKGLLDQDFYPETDYVPPSIEFMRDELIRIRQLGFNTVRYHVKTPPSEYVELADELGLLLWIDLPYAKAFDAESKSYLERLRDDLMMRYSSSPSFCILTLINESWGIDLSQSVENKWLYDFWKASKSVIADRLIVDNSACLGNHHVISDLNDFHFYHAYPEKGCLSAD